MKPLPRIALSFTLTGLLLLALVTTMALAAPAAAPSTTPSFAPNSQTVNLAASKDNTLYEHPSGLLSNGAGEYLFAGKTNNSDLIRRGLMAFDIASNIPSGSTILSATLILNMSKSISGAEPVSLHSVQSNWGEGASDASGEEGGGIAAESGDATWLHTFYTSTLWTTAGGDFNPTASATTQVGGVGSYSWSSPQMVADIQAWLDSPASDYGWLLQGNEAVIGTAKRFDTRENPTPANQPSLMVTYEPPLPIINELDADQVGTDAAEFIELYDGGLGNTPLDGLVIVFYNGSNDLSYAAYDLDGFTTNANGYFLLGNSGVTPTPEIVFANNFLQQGADAVALFTDDATTFPNGTAVTTTNLIDAIVYDTNDADDPGLLTLLNPGQPQVNEGSSDSTIDSNQRCPNGSGGYRNTDTYIQALPSAGTSNNCPEADVTVSKSGPSVAQPGSTISYTIVYENIGGLDTFDVVLTDTLPASYATYVSDDSGLICPACTLGASGTITWSVGTISATDSFTFSLVALITDTVPFGEVLTNHVTIATSSTEITTTNNASQWATNISAFDLSVNKAAPAFSLIGAPLTYDITLQNMGVATATNVILTDVLPLNTIYTSDDSGTACPACIPGATGPLTFTVGDVAPNTSISFMLVVTVTNSATSGDIITNTVTATTDAAEDNSSNNSDSVTTAVYNTFLPIHDIQGESHFSPYDGQNVANVPGIVTVVTSSGFYLQDPVPDNSDSSSEGIFVFTGSPPTVNVGDYVLISGSVSEFYPGGVASGNLPTTQISSPTIVVGSSGNPLPAATILGTNGRIPPNTIIDDDGFTIFDPASDGIDFYESVEGMLVQVENGLVVGSKRFGEIQIVGDGGANATGLNSRGSIVINASDFNPERIIIDDTFVANEPFAEVGYTFNGNVIGIMDYNFGNYKLLNPAPLPSLTPGGLVSETSNLVATADHLTVATFNVLNLDPSASTFAGLADEIINHLNAPDIIGLEEIQDNNGETNDGTTDASQTYGTLITAIANAGGPTYEFRDIAPTDNMDGGAPGGNIRVGFLFQPARVTFVDRPGGNATTATTPQLGPNGVELTLSPGRIEPTNSAFTDSRKSLVGEFLFNDQTIFVIANHFNSKSGDEPLFGANQPPVLNSEVQRLQQAQIVHDFVASIQALDANANVIVLGDLNDFQFSPPLATLQNGVLTNLMDTLPANEQYTYIFDGNAQVLDHILASDNLAAVAAVDVVHVNAEFDESHRASDHDPVLARFTLPAVEPSGYSLYLPFITKADTPPTSNNTTTAPATQGIMVASFGLLPMLLLSWKPFGRLAKRL